MSFIALRDFLEETAFGTVLFTLNKPDGSTYGFIQPDYGNGERELNLFFGTQAMQGESFERGDQVIFAPMKNRARAAAFRVWHK